MPPDHHDKHPQVKAQGEVTDVFVHRFVLKTQAGKVLADLTPHGAEEIRIAAGDKVKIEGEQKPSEIKVARLTRADHTYVIIDKGPKKHGGHHHDHHGKHHEHAEKADPAIAVKAVEKAGYVVLGAARRKPKHFEVLGKKGRLLQELHIEPDGEIRKTKPVPADDHKWRTEIAAAR